MSERTVELDEPVMDEQSQALQSAVDRAERAEAELAKLKNKAAHTPAAAAESKPGKSYASAQLDASDEAPKHKARQVSAEKPETPVAGTKHEATHAATHDAAESGDLFPARGDKAEPSSSDADDTSGAEEHSTARKRSTHQASAPSEAPAPATKHKESRISGDADEEIASSTPKRGSSHVSSDDAEAIAPRGTSSTAHADPTGKHLVEPGSMDARKQDAAQEPEGHAVGDPEVHGIEALREDAMMRHLLDSLDRGEDIGHYGRLTFSMIARHFLEDDEVLAEMTKDETCSEEDARQMLVQVEGRDYSPPRRERILEWQSEQEFPIIPDKHDPDCGNVYKSLRFPKQTYSHIGHYQEEKASS